MRFPTPVAASSAKHPGGRPSKYDPAYCDQLIAHFDITPYTIVDSVVDGIRTKRRQASDPPLLIDFARSIKVHLDTLYEWQKRHQEFKAAMTLAHALQEKFYIVNGVHGLTNPTITKLILLNNFGYREQAETPPTQQLPAPKFIFHINGTTKEVSTAELLNGR